MLRGRRRPVAHALPTVGGPWVAAVAAASVPSGGMYGVPGSATVWHAHSCDFDCAGALGSAELSDSAELPDGSLSAASAGGATSGTAVDLPCVVVFSAASARNGVGERLSDPSAVGVGAAGASASATCRPFFGLAFAIAAAGSSSAALSAA